MRPNKVETDRELWTCIRSLCAVLYCKILVIVFEQFYYLSVIVSLLQIAQAAVVHKIRLHQVCTVAFFILRITPAKRHTRKFLQSQVDKILKPGLPFCNAGASSATALLPPW